MKHCPKCKETKQEEEFNKNSKKEDGLQSYCRNCQKLSDRNSYINNPKRREAIRVNDQKRILEIRNYVYALLLENPCKDCLEKDPIVLEFDHKFDKKFDISDGMRRFNLDRLKTELIKCEIVCSNCHKKRTAKQYNNWKIKYADIAQSVSAAHL